MVLHCCNIGFAFMPVFMPYSCSDTCDTCDGLRAKINTAENEDERSKLEKELQNHLDLAEQCLCKDWKKAEHRGHKLDRTLCAYNTILYNYYGAIVHACFKTNGNVMDQLQLLIVFIIQIHHHRIHHLLLGRSMYISFVDPGRHSNANFFKFLAFAGLIGRGYCLYNDGGGNCKKWIMWDHIEWHFLWNFRRDICKSYPYFMRMLFPY